MKSNTENGSRSTEKQYRVLTGAIHVHTLDSDGTKTHEEVAAIGREAGLEFLLFSDHMTLQSLHEDREGYYDDLLVLIGYEHNDREDCNHYLIFDQDELLPASMKAGEYVKAAAEKGALGIMAHPDEIRGRDARFRSYPWTDWEVEGFDGLEIWNQMSEWMEHLTIFNQIRMVFSPRKCLESPTRRILKKWDELNRKRKVVGIGSVDAHGFLYRAGPLRLTIFPYKVQFKSIRSHLLLEEPLSKDFNIARKQVYDAIRDCRLFVSNYRWGEAKDFRFEIRSGSHCAISGGTVALDDNTRVIARIPAKARVNLIANGRPVAEKLTKDFEEKITVPGVYRIEIYRRKKGWIFTNHIRVTG